MKVNLKRRITTFLYLRSHNWQQRLCLITFMVLCLSVVILGVPMHMAGLIGRGDTTLYAISAVTWVATAAILALFIMKRLRLNVAISTFGIITQLAESTRIVYAAVVQPEGFADTILFNQIISGSSDIWSDKYRRLSVNSAPRRGNSPQPRAKPWV